MSAHFDQGLKAYLIFLLSVSAHEAAHAIVAKKLGDPTAANGGQTSFNPWPHIRRAPFGMVAVPLFTWFSGGYIMGWAHIPLDPEWTRANPKRAALVALAGPAANLAIFIVGLVLLFLGIKSGHFSLNGGIVSEGWISGAAHGDEWSFAAARLLDITLSLNLLLFVFNLLPLPPLDGVSLPPLLLPSGAGSRYVELIRNPGLSWIGLFFAWKISGPVFLFVARVVGAGIARAFP